MWKKLKRIGKRIQLETAMFVAGIEPIFYTKSRREKVDGYNNRKVENLKGDATTPKRLSISQEIRRLTEENGLDMRDLTVFLGCRNESEVEKILTGSTSFSERVYEDKLERFLFYIRIFNRVKDYEHMSALNRKVNNLSNKENKREW